MRKSKRKTPKLEELQDLEDTLEISCSGFHDKQYKLENYKKKPKYNPKEDDAN